MNFALLIIFMFVAFGLTTLFRKWIDVPTLIAVAIGCAVNANIFNPLTAPIVVGPFTFSIEIVLYTLFMYTLVVRMLDYSYQDAKRLTLTSVAAIIISAIIELMAKLMTFGFAVETFKIFSYYLFSSLGTIIGAWLMVFIARRLQTKKVSCYIVIPISIAISSVVHALFYYGGIALVEWNFGMYSVLGAVGTMIGKTVCIALSILCYFINKKYWRPSNLIEKEIINKDNENE